MSDNKNIIEEDENDTVDYRDDEQEGGIFRWMSVFVVLLAVAGFFSLAWYAYKSGGEVTSESDAELITAEATPVKEAPENPGGIAIPNQDKAVYGLVGGKQEESKVVEHILASPETPIVRNEESDTGSWMSEEVREKLKASEGDKPETNADEEQRAIVDDGKEVPKEKKDTEVANNSEKEAAKESAEETVKEVVKAAEEKTTAITKEEPKKEETKKAEAKSEAPKVAESKKAPVEIKELKLAASEGKPKEEPKKEESKKEAAKAETSTSPASGVARVQLGAFKSEAEASGQWKKIEKKFSGEVSGKQHYIVRADLGAKGIFYRLQVAPFDSSKDAERYCMSFVSEGQGCMPVKGK